MASSFEEPGSGGVRDLATLVGRVLVAFLFVPAGFGKLTNFHGTASYIAAGGLPWPEVAAATAIAVELGFGLAFLVGYRVRSVASVLAAFTVVTAFAFHAFWSLPEPQRTAMKIHFGKNMAIAGGLLAFAAFGGGRFAIDHAARGRRR